MFSLDRAFLKLKSVGSNSLSLKVDALKSMLSHLIDFDTKALLKLYEKD